MAKGGTCEMGETRKRKLQPFPFGPSSRRKTKSGDFISVALALLALTIQTSPAQIKIGAVTCLTGALSTFGISSLQGARIAEEDVNASGGVLGQPIDLVVEDNGSKAGEAATITRKFISQDK